MQVPLRIVSRDFPLPAWAEGIIRERSETLDRYDPRLVGCRVQVDGPGPHHRRGPYRVRVTASSPGRQIAVTKQHAEDLGTAVVEAFDALVRRIEDAVRLRRGDVKSLGESPRALVARLFRGAGYGFLEADGREIYFHRNSVLPPGFDRLRVGSPVRFVEEEGRQGPQASTVAPLGGARGGRRRAEPQGSVR